jgi:DNA-binding Xre family transcriptional regulator
VIVYTPIWETMKRKGFTTYTLRVKHGISSSTVQRIQRNQPLTTTTLNDLCKLLQCSLSEIAEYVED